MESENLKRLLKLLNGNDDRPPAEETRAEIAAEYNLPEQLADRIRGESLEEIKADAAALASICGIKREAAPLADPEQGTEHSEPDRTKEAYKKMLADTFGRYNE